MAVRLITSLDGVELTEPRFEVVEGRAVDKADAEAGYVAGGKGVSPYDNLVIDSQYIKAEAQAGRMSQVMYAVSRRNTAGRKREFRSPTQDDLDALRNASDELERLKADWLAAGILPAEEVDPGLKTQEPIRFGMTSWQDFFHRSPNACSWFVR